VTGVMVAGMTLACEDVGVEHGSGLAGLPSRSPGHTRPPSCSALRRGTILRPEPLSLALNQTTRRRNGAWRTPGQTRF
jgi:hypothetical protein